MEADREKFRAYVEKSGLMSTLTNVLVDLYEETEKPQDPLEYIKKALGAKTIDEKKFQMLQQRLKEMEAENTSLKERLVEKSKEDSTPTPIASTEPIVPAPE